MSEQPLKRDGAKPSSSKPANALAGMIVAASLILGGIGTLVAALTWYARPDATMQQLPADARRLAETERTRLLIQRLQQKHDDALGSATQSPPAAPASDE